MSHNARMARRSQLHTLSTECQLDAKVRNATNQFERGAIDKDGTFCDSFCINPDVHRNCFSSRD